LVSKKAEVDKEVRERLRAWVKYERDRRQLSQAKFAELLGGKTTQATISEIETGAKDMGLEVLLRFANKARKSLDYLIDVDPPRAAEGQAPPNPTEASPSSAATERHRKTGRE
jgi:transcriptional regulator with XRE-family HTH domain